MKHIKIINIITILCGTLYLTWLTMSGISTEAAVLYDLYGFEVSHQRLFFLQWVPEAFILTVFFLLVLNIFSLLLEDMKELKRKGLPLDFSPPTVFLVFLVYLLQLNFNFVNVCDDDGSRVLITQGWVGIFKFPGLGKVLNLVIFAGLYNITRKYLREHFLKDLQDSRVSEK